MLVESKVYNFNLVREWCRVLECSNGTCTARAMMTFPST